MPYSNLILPLRALFYRMWRHFLLDDSDTQKVPGVAQCSPPPLHPAQGQQCLFFFKRWSTSLSSMLSFQSLEHVWLKIICLNSAHNPKCWDIILSQKGSSEAIWTKFLRRNDVTKTRPNYWVLFKMAVTPGMGGGVLPEKMGGGVRPTSQNPYPIYDQNLRFLLPYLWPIQKFDSLFMTVAADTVAPNISYQGLLLTVLSMKTKR